MLPSVRIRNVAVILFAHVAVTFILASGATADDSKTIAVFEEQAKDYKFKDADSDNPLVMHSRPLLHWANPARNGEDGAVFLWKKGEQPIVIGTCFTYRYRDSVNRKHAFHILGDEGVQCRHDGRMVWTPEKNSLDHKPLAIAPPPAATPSGRNTQLRGLARHFHVDVTLNNGRKERARLVPQPLYRYEDSGTQSGAIFSFAIGTDPEALLILSQRKGESGKPAWHYAFARFTFYPLEGFLDGESVWKLEESENLRTSILTRPDYQRQPYVTFKPDYLD